MADPFANLNAPETGASAGAVQAPAKSDPFSNLNAPEMQSGKPASPPPSTAKDVGLGAAQGVKEGIENTIGLGGDIRHRIDYGMLWAEAKAAEKMGELPKGQTAEDVIQKYRGSAGRAFLSQLGVPDTAIDWLGGGAPTTGEVHGVTQALGAPDYQPQTTAGQYARTIGSFVPGAMLAPAESLPEVGMNVLRYGVAPGATSELAGQATKGQPYEPLARLAGAVAGGATGPIVSKGWQAGKNFVEPMTKEGPQNIAARGLQKTFTDPKQAAIDLEVAKALQTPGFGMGEIVPGSKPRTGQLLGDTGALQFERQTATERPDLYHFNMAGTGADQQNEARSAALQGIQQTGAPTSVAEAIRSGLSDIEATHDQTVQSALAQAQGRAAGVGQGLTPEAQGEAVRASLQAGRDAAKAKERALWNAVDSNGTLSLPASPIVNGAKTIAGSVPQTAKPMAGEEAAIFDTASNLPNVASFNDVTALRSRISAAMRDEMRASGSTPTYARLSQLRGSVEGAIENAAENKAAQEAQAVSQGTMPSDETMAAKLQAQIDEFQRARAQAAGTSPGQGIGNAATAGPSGLPRPDRAEVPPGGGLGNPPGNQGVPPASWDDEAAARLKVASASTKERAQTFDQGPVGDVLRKGQSASDYLAPNSAVPAKVWRPGPQGAQTAQAYGAATSNMDPLFDTAAESLRREAMTPEGVIDPKKFATWQAKHQDALRALPAPLKAKFSNAAQATQAYADAAVARKEAIDAYQKGIASRFLGLSHGQDVTRAVGSIFGSPDGVRQMQELAARVASSPEAKEGLRKAVADHIVSLATGTTEAGSSGINNLNASRFQSFVAKNRATIKAAGFGDAEIANMQALADDLQRAQRTMQATKLPASSNTAQDLLHPIKAAADEAGKPSLLMKIVTAAWAGREGASWLGIPGVGAAIGGIGAIGRHLSSTMRGAGLAKARDLMQQAILDPEVARDLLKRASSLPNDAAEESLAKTLQKRAMYSFPGAYSSVGDRQGRADGGSVKRKPHHELVSRLMDLAERAKREEKARTKPILNVPDNAVASALAKANAAI